MMPTASRVNCRPTRIPYYAIMAHLVEKMAADRLESHGVIPWSSPVPVFGDVSNAQVATVGLNPSNLEFLDGRGHELHGDERRFHTLRSLDLTCWSAATSRHIHRLWDRCLRYFVGRPYDAWFRQLDYVMAGAGATYYGLSANACHLDLVPFATFSKWGELRPGQKRALLNAGAATLACVVRDSPVSVMILNGKSVVEYFADPCGVLFESEVVAQWQLARRAGDGVQGISYRAQVDHFAGIDLHKTVLVLGYNHNIQSSFGVTVAVRKAVREWVKDQLSSRVSSRQSTSLSPPS